MILSEMIKLLESYADDTVDIVDAIAWLNMGQNKMAIAVESSFPQLAQGTVETFSFPTKYHEAPVLYAAAMYKAQDSSIREKDSFLNQFYEMVREFSQNYDPPKQYQDTSNVQQFTALNSQDIFIITKGTYSPRYGSLRVYRNGVITFDFDIDGNILTIRPPANTGEIITAEWDEFPAFTEKPVLYPGW